MADILIPKHLLERLRMRRGLEPNDDSEDEQISRLTPEQKLREIVAWELGDPDWADTILDWAEECGMEISSHG